MTRHGRRGHRLLLRRAAHDVPVDRELGTRRARAAALLTPSLPGGVCLCQGDELGLWEV
ncbi:hypothetical protein ABT279_06980 [Amycolatopsis sp. NPDC000673]|uniref:Uncharacterized protein n=1 Tax=Amycolatopsis albidoflavus TaxID=102226 RepID=A0ABW5HRM1_9PSEU